MFTREDIESIRVGWTQIAFSLNGESFSEPSEVLSIHARGEDPDGKLYVCGYRRFGFASEMSFSIKEGSEVDFRLYRINNRVTA